MLSRSLACVRVNLKLYRADFAPVLLLVLMPLGFISFMVPTTKALLEAQGYQGVTGAEHVLPGMMVMFAFFLLGIVGDQYFREHGWGTWERLRVAADTRDIMIGKTVPALGVLAGQLALVFLAGKLIFGMNIAGPVLGVVMILAAFAACLVSLLLVLVAYCSTFTQLNVLNTLMVMVFSGLGGSFADVSLMPAWVQAAARFTPAYWAIQGLRDVILDGAGLAYAARMSGMILVFAVAFGALAAVRFRAAEAKVADNT